MINFTKTTVLVAAILASNTHAGAMGPIESTHHTLFTALEGAYSWNSIQSVIIQGTQLNKNDKGWSGRIAAGATHYSNNRLSYTGEMGWGYYGNTRFHSEAFGLKYKLHVYGMDFLVGPNYQYNQFDLFIKAGGMWQNYEVNRRTDFSNFVAGPVVNGVATVKYTTSVVVPEVKVGGIYNINDNLGISLAYMYVFGGDMSYSTNQSSFTGDVTNNSNIKNGNGPVGLSTLMLGLRYSFS